MKAFLKFLLGVFFIVLLGLAALVNDAMPGSVASAEQELAESVRATLAANDAGWASAKISGQKILLTGEAPSAASRDALVEAVAHAEGNGGPVFGGVTSIDATELTFAASPALEISETAPAGRNEAPQSEPALSEDLLVAEADSSENQSDRAAPAVETGQDEIADTPETQATAEAAILEQEAENDCAERIQAAIDQRRIGFSSARADIDNPSRAQLRDIAALLTECPEIELRITGHTDASGNAARNMQLSGYRADAVRAFLSSVGAPADRLSARGIGSTEALVSNDTPEGREQNRRIEIEVIRRDE
jgi:outer membrane protein OmpA-like peptidoglycan-associated protein